MRFAPPTTEADFRRHYYREAGELLADARAEVSAMPAEMAAFVQAMDATGPWEPVPLVFANNPPWGPAEWSFIAGCLERMAAMAGRSGSGGRRVHRQPRRHDRDGDARPPTARSWRGCARWPGRMCRSS